MPDMCKVEKVKYKAQEERLPFVRCRCDHRGHVGIEGMAWPGFMLLAAGFLTY